MSEKARSERACPVCGAHQLALDEPPRIDVMGVQLYSDIIGMGDLRQEGAIGIMCRNCGSHWHDKAAFDRNEPEPDAGPHADGTYGLEDDPRGDEGGDAQSGR